MSHRPHRTITPYGPITTGAGEAIIEGVGDLAKAVVKAPKNFFHYMWDDIGKEHAEEEEHKRQAILANRKK